MATRKILGRGKRKGGSRGSRGSVDDSRHFLAASKQSRRGLLQQSRLYPMPRHNNPGTPLKLPRQALLRSPPHQTDTKPSSQPRLLPWPVELLPWPSATQP